MPVPVPVVGDPEGDGLVVARAQVLDDLRAGRLAAGPGVFTGQVGLAEDDDHLFCPGLEAAGAELGDRAAASYDVSRALLDAGEVTEHLLVGGVPVGDQDAGEERQDRGDRRGAPRAHGPQPGQFPAGRADDQHVRRALFRFPGTAGKDVDRGLVSAEYWLAGESGLHRVIEPGGLQLLVQPGAGPVHEPRRDPDAEQHADQPGGTFGRHVPVPAEQHRGPVDSRAIGNGPRVRARRRVRGRQLPAARAQQRRQQPLGHPPGDPHVPDLRPLRAPSFRPGQARPASRALRRRIRGLPLIRIGVPGQASTGVPGLPAALAVLATLPLGSVPVFPLGLAASLRPDRLLRARRPRVAAVHPQAAFQLGEPQLQPPFPFHRRRQLGPQHPDFGVLRLHHSPQPGQQLTLLPVTPRQIGLIGHEPQACST